MSEHLFSELAELIAINSYTGNKQGVDKVGLLLQQWLQPLGFKTQTFQREHIGNHLLFKSERSEGGRRVLLLGHIDTVFPPGTFETFEEDDEWVYGPGVCDMKGGVMVSLQALRNVAATLGHIQNIDWLLVSDEETGSDDSRFVSAELAKDYDICLDFEAAGRDHEVVVARKGVGTYTIELEGKAAHAGNHYADGADANLAAAHMVIALTALTDLGAGTTVNAGKISGGIGANTISPKASILLELRYTSMAERNRVLEAINEICQAPEVAGVSASLSGRIQREVMEPSESQTALLEIMAEALGYPLPVEHRGGVSDANLFSAAGLATLDGFGPYGHGDHTVHECANKASFYRRIDETTKILLALNAD